LLRSQGRTILGDTGMGSTVTNPGAVAMFTGGADGHLLEELQAVGNVSKAQYPHRASRRAPVPVWSTGKEASSDRL